MAKSKDITGQFSGDLIARNFTGKSDLYGNKLWNCECLLCGKFKEIRVAEFNLKKFKNCGCDPQKTKREKYFEEAKKHIETKVYNVLITEILPHAKGERLKAKGVCECGNDEFIFTLKDLLSGNTKSCCRYSETSNMVGQIHEFLYVYDFAPTEITNDNRKFRSYWCECLICGNKRTYRALQLLYKQVKACGCLGIKNLSKDNPLRQKYRNIRYKNHLEKCKKYIGTNKNYWIVKDILESNSGPVLAIANCKCTPNIDRKIKLSRIISGIQYSCGCYQKEMASKISAELQKIDYWREYRRRDWYYIKDGQKIHMKSSYEVVLANILDERGVAWEYEPEIIELTPTKRYIPDFYIFDTDEWLETKGLYTDDDKLKISLFRNLGYKITVLFREDLEKEFPISYYRFMKEWDEKHPRIIDTVN